MRCACRRKERTQRTRRKRHGQRAPPTGFRASRLRQPPRRSGQERGTATAKKPVSPCERREPRAAHASPAVSAPRFHTPRSAGGRAARRATETRQKLGQRCLQNRLTLRRRRRERRRGVAPQAACACCKPAVTRRRSGSVAVTVAAVTSARRRAQAAACCTRRTPARPA